MQTTGGCVKQVIGVDDELPMRQDALYIAARAPRPGFTKSRLGRAIGHVAAATLYAAFVRDLSARLSRAPVSVGWYITPDDAWPELEPLVPADWTWNAPPGMVIVQPPGDWTERQCQLLATASVRGERRTILIASDSPQLGLDTIAEAFARLDRDDLVLGPTEDGGYYLVGVRSPADPDSVRPWEALAGVRMSTGTVLDEILSRAAGLGLRTSLLSPTFDVDEVADLERLIPLALRRDDLAATRAALQTLGLVHCYLEAGEQVTPVAVAVGGVR
jgi:uncharacterized protein